MISYKKCMLIILAFVLISSMAVVSADDSNQTEIASSNHPETVLGDDFDTPVEEVHEYYVSGDGDDFVGNGTSESPFASVGFAVSVANNNSKIIVRDGTYKGTSNTGITINKHLTIEGQSKATINGENKYWFFKVSRDSSLTLKNINFVNGKTDSYSQLGVINNEGELIVNNSSFNNMRTVMAAIFNEGSLTVNNTNVVNAYSANMAQIITNVGDCTVLNSKFTAHPTSSSEVAVTVYNYKNLNVINSQIGNLQSNPVYDEYNYHLGFVFINNSVCTDFELGNMTARIFNSRINGNSELRGANVFLDNVIFAQSSSFSILSISESNLTAIHSIFQYTISCSFTDLNITYSSILGPIYGGGKIGFLFAPYNWWGSNNGPSFEYFRNYYTEYWAVATFETEDGNQSVGTNSKFITAINKWSDGSRIYDFAPDEYLPSRPVYFESQNGRFLYQSGTLNNNFTNYLINNILDCLVYCVIDDERLSITIGDGMSAYQYFVSPGGHDGPEDGTLEKPFWSLEYAVKMAGNGNTICLLNGTYKFNPNSNVAIDKNLTIVGFEDVTLVRANAFSVFNVQEWGNLLVKNIKFTVDVREYDDPIINLMGGNVTIINCNFTGITAPSIIFTVSGNNYGGLVYIEDCKFDDIVGAVSRGTARTYVRNSTFENIRNYYNYQGMEYYNNIFPITSSIEIYDSLFRQNYVGVINLHPYSYSSSSLLGATYSQYSESYGRYAYVENTVFENNVFKSSSYSSSGVGLLIHDSYGTFDGFVKNCSFTGNRGKIAYATNVNDCYFYNNHGEAYGGEALVSAVLIENSIFEQNLNQYIDYDDAYLGEGIASADTILRSIFINNRASFGGAVSASKQVHYCVFVNNTAKYSGNDIYSASGDVDYSSNWWGDNQKPTTDNIFIFLGNLKLNDWVIMSLESVSGTVVEAALNNLVDDMGNIRPIGYEMPVRPVYFMINGGAIAPELTYLSNNRANATLAYDFYAQDLKVYARIDNQLLDLDVKNTNTRILMSDVAFKGKDYKYELSLVNVNGYQISNQTLNVEIVDPSGESYAFTILADENGYASFNVDYPIGIYTVNVNYMGNGYFDKSNNSAIIEVIPSVTSIVAYNATYYGKNNRYYAILYGEEGRKLVNMHITFTVTNSKGISSKIVGTTDMYGQSEIIFSLDVGKYTIRSEFLGDSWYNSSFVERSIEIKPANSTLIVPEVTLYGQGNVYNITLKDVYGTLIRGENIVVTLSQGDIYDRFVLKTDDNGKASLEINYLPGTYNVRAEFKGDEIYGPSVNSSVIHVEKVLTILSGFSHVTVPLKGIYTVVLSDMYGKRVNNETIILNCYQGKLIKSYQLGTDSNGEASFVIDLDEGNYLTTFDYGGNEWYADATNAATIIVSKEAVLQNIQINSTDLVQYYGEDKFFIIEFNDPNAYSQYGKTLQVSITSEEWSRSYEVITDVFGLGRLKITLNPGKYNITYKYSNDYYNIFGSGSNTITVYKMPTTILGKDVIVQYGEARQYEISLRDVNNVPIKNMQVHADINGTKYNLTTNNDGIAKLLLNLDEGMYTISYSMDNPNYLPSNGSSIIYVVDSDKISTNLDAADIVALDNETAQFKVTLSDSINKGISSSKITLEISTFDGEPVKTITKTTDRNGIVMFDLELEYGKYIVRAIYDGNDLYLPSSSINTIDIESSDGKIKTVMIKGETNIKNSKYYVVLADVNGTLLVNMPITFSVDGKYYSAVTDLEGKAYLDVELYPNVYTVKAVFSGDDDYKKVSTSAKLFVSGDSTQLYALELVKYYRNGTQFHARLVSNTGAALANKTMVVVVDNVTYNCTTDDDGWITLKVDLKPGIYDVECYYYGRIPFENSFNQTTISVLKTVLGENAIRYYGETPYLNVRFLAGNGELIKNAQFVINIDGTNYIATIGSNGVFNFNLNLASGSHVIGVTNPYDGFAESYDLEILPTIFADKIVKLLGDGQYYSVLFIGKDGVPLIDCDVDVIIDGIKYVYRTDYAGEIKVNMELAPKSYLVTVINPDTGEYIESTIDVFAPIIENENLVMYYNNGASYKVKIIGKNGKPVGSGVLVKFKIKDKTYDVITDKEGYASLKITLKPDKYTVVVTYANYKVSNKITVKPVLTAKNVSKKKGKVIRFKAKLVNGKGKPLKGKKITFKFKSKKYKAKTNKKGVATLKLKLKLKVGKYTIKTSYGKSKIKNKITIRK